MDTVTELMIYLKLKHSPKLSFGLIFKHPCLSFSSHIQSNRILQEETEFTQSSTCRLVQNYDSGTSLGQYDHYDINDMWPSNTFAKIWRNCLLILNLIFNENVWHSTKILRLTRTSPMNISPRRLNTWLPQKTFNCTKTARLICVG